MDYFPKHRPVARKMCHLHSSILSNFSFFFLEQEKKKSQWGEIIPLVPDAISHQDIFTTQQQTK